MTFTSTDRGRPAKITFERLPVENVNLSQQEGRAIFDDVDFVTLHQAGSNNTTIHKVEEWWIKLEQQLRNGAIPAEWVDEYKKAYAAWSQGEEPVVQGTHLREWAKISRSQAEMWNAVHVRTVEELAAANEETLAAYGMGGRAMKQEAQKWLDSLKDGEVLQEKVEKLTETVQKQEDMINELLDKLAEADKPKTTAKKKTSRKKAATKAE